MFGLPDAAIGAIAAALIAGLISLLGLIISKEQKISDFRQAWIDGLRLEFAQLISQTTCLHTLTSTNVEDPSEAWRAIVPHLLGANEAMVKIRLRLNPVEPISRKILSYIDEHELLLAPGMTSDYQKVDEIQKKMMSEAQALLKLEWVRVRKGEFVYQSAKLVALGVIVLSVLFPYVYGIGAKLGWW